MKINHKSIVWEIIHSINLDQDGNECWDFVTAVILQVPQTKWNLTSWATISFSRWTLLHEISYLGSDVHSLLSQEHWLNCWSRLLFFRVSILGRSNQKVPLTRNEVCVGQRWVTSKCLIGKTETKRRLAYPRRKHIQVDVKEIYDEVEQICNLFNCCTYAVVIIALHRARSLLISWQSVSFCGRCIITNYW
jgi:hypothetical protein